MIDKRIQVNLSTNCLEAGALQNIYAMIRIVKPKESNCPNRGKR